MYCVCKVSDELTWIGVNDRRLSMFEGVYSVPYGVSYNSHCLRALRYIWVFHAKAVNGNIVSFGTQLAINAHSKKFIFYYVDQMFQTLCEVKSKELSEKGLAAFMAALNIRTALYPQVSCISAELQ